MFANSVEEIYTLLFGWTLYEAIWEMLVATGIAFIPFLVAVYNAFSGGQNGTIVGSRAGQAQGELEMSIFAMILVLMLGVIPWTGFGGTNMGNMEYGIETPYCPVSVQANHSLDGDADNTGTENDTTFSSMNTYTVNPPPLWSMVMLLSSAMTNSAIASIDCINNYNFMLARMKSIQLNDAVVTERVENFNTVCYQVALADFNLNPFPVPANTSMLDRPDWAGATPFFNTADRFYLHEKAYISYPDGKYGFVADPATRDADATNPGTVNPSCAEVWYGDGIPGGTAEPLRTAILDAIPDDEVGSIRDDWVAWGFEVVTATLTDEQKEDLLIRMVLEGMKGDKINVNYQPEGFTANYGTGMPDWLKGIADVVANVTTGGITTVKSLGQITETAVLKIVAPVMVSFAQMMIIIVAPFILVTNAYSFASFLQLSLLYFTLEFTAFAWAVAGYFEQHFTMLYMDLPDSSNMFTSTFMPFVTAYSYILLPAAWFVLAGMMGVSVMKGFGAIVRGGGAGEGAGSMALQGAKMGAGAGKAIASKVAKGFGK